MKSKKALKISLISLASLVLVAAIVLAVFIIGFKNQKYERYNPSTDTEILNEAEMRKILEKPLSEITDEEYSVLYLQTGLTKLGVASVMEDEGIEGVLYFQEMYFDEYELVDDFFAPFCNYISMDSYADMVPLQNGDIIVAASTFFAGWKLGHAALVIDADKGYVLEAIGIGSDSTIGYADILLERPSFMVLRPNVDPEIVENVVQYAKNNLLGIPYDPTVGILSPKYDPEIPQTQCSHIIWFAFMQYGIDLDSNGGLLVMPKDISNSQYLDLVQNFGFHPEELWKE